MCKNSFRAPLTNSYKLHPLTKPFSCCCLFTPNPLRGGTHDPNYERGNETIPFQFRKTGQKPSAILKKESKMFPSRSRAPLAIAIPCYFRLSSSPLDWFSQHHNPRDSDHFQSSSALCYTFLTKSGQPVKPLRGGVNHCWSKAEGHTNESYPLSFSDFNWSEVMGNFCAHKSRPQLVLNNWFDGFEI